MRRKGSHEETVGSLPGAPSSSELSHSRQGAMLRVQPVSSPGNPGRLRAGPAGSHAPELGPRPAPQRLRCCLRRSLGSRTLW